MALQLFGVVAVQVTAPMAPSVPWVGPVTMLKVRLLPSASEPVRVMTFAVSSFVVTDCTVAVGASLTAVTVIETVAAVADSAFHR